MSFELVGGFFGSALSARVMVFVGGRVLSLQGVIFWLGAWADGFGLVLSFVGDCLVCHFIIRRERWRWRLASFFFRWPVDFTVECCWCGGRSLWVGGCLCDFPVGGAVGLHFGRGLSLKGCVTHMCDGFDGLGSRFWSVGFAVGCAWFGFVRGIIVRDIVCCLGGAQQVYG